jgi:hypothetical protein
MAPICSGYTARTSYIVPFNPHGAPGPTILTVAQSFNRDCKRLRWGSAITPYPDAANVYCWSVISDPRNDMFEDLYLRDL